MTRVDTVEAVITADDSKFRSAMSASQKASKALQRTLISLAGAAGAGALAKSFLNAARVSENYRIRLNALLGSTSEGARAFKEMAKFAGSVPFEFQEIMGSATQLSGVLRGGVDEIKQVMPVIADLAAVSGLSIRQTTEQVVRMFSAGAASADLFRERGITAMLGFQAGVSVSAKETRDRVIAAWEDTNSKFRGASVALAETWDGLMSMLSDKWFQFQNQVADAGIFDFVKAIVAELDEGFGKTLEETEVKARNWANTLIDATKKIIKAFAVLRTILDTFKVLLKTMELGFTGFALLIADRVHFLVRLANKARGLVNMAPMEITETVKTMEDALLDQTKIITEELAALAGDFKDRVVKNEQEALQFIENVTKRMEENIRKREELLARDKKKGFKPPEALPQDEKVLESIRNEALKLIPTYERLKAAADRWKMETIKGLDKTKKDYGKWIKVVEQIYKEKLKKAYLDDLENRKDWEAGVKRGLERIKDSTEDAATQAEELFTGAFDRLEDALVDFVRTGKFEFKDLVDFIISEVARIVIRKNIIAPLAELVGGGSLVAGGGGGIGGFFQDIFGGVFGSGATSSAPDPSFSVDLSSFSPFASGGRTQAGKPITVGEQGPELFIPDQPGRIQHNTSGSGAGVTVVQQFTIQAGVSQTVRAEMMQLLPAFEDRAKRGVKEAINNGGEYARTVGVKK